MWSTELAVFSLNVFIKLAARPAQEFEAFNPGQSESIECQQRKPKLNNNILHREIARQENDMLRTLWLNLYVFALALFCLFAKRKVTWY